MKFTGQIRIPEVDHPGVRATILIDDVQAEVVVEGDSLGRWSLYDIHARRLVSTAFQVELAGEEITFLADDPVEFAYRGVEHMAEVWARFTSMNVAHRPIAVRRSRKGATPSKISELRDAMVENLEAELNGFLTEKKSVGQDVLTAESVEQEIEPLSINDKSVEPMEPATETRIPVIGETTGHEGDRLEAQRAKEERVEQQRLESVRLEDEKRTIDEERARLEAEKQRLEAERLKADQIEADRVEALGLEVERFESEREDQQRLEANRSETSRQELERLQGERADMERLEAQRAESARKELASIEKKRKEIERLDIERLEQESHDIERREAIQAEIEQLEAQRAEHLRLDAARVEQERSEAEKLEQEQAAAERKKATAAERKKATAAERKKATAAERKKAAEEQEAAAAMVEQERLDAEKASDNGALGESPPSLVKDLLSTSGDSDDTEVSLQLIIDLSEFDELATEPESDSETDSHPEPALAGGQRGKSGIMSAVRRISRNGRSHVHELVEVPGGLGIGRSICEDCGHVSISSSD